MALTLKDHDRHGYADYLHWQEDVRHELIDGIVSISWQHRGRDLPADRERQARRPGAGRGNTGRVLLGVTILWDALAARLPRPEC
ncbi:MAG: hypothetical protein ACT4QB_19040 [Gammaproteobacteria bacterium]